MPCKISVAFKKMYNQYSFLLFVCSHFNDSGSKLASGSDDLEVIVWDWMRGKKICSFPTGHTSNVFQSKFLPLTGDSHIVTCSRDGQVRLAQLSETGTCQRTKKVAQHRRASHKLALFRDRPHEFISGGEDGLIFDIDVRADKPNKLLVQKEGDRPVGIFSVHVRFLTSFQFLFPLLIWFLFLDQSCGRPLDYFRW